MTRRRSGMGLLAFGLALAAAGTLAGVRAATLYGCGGTPIVVCSRTAYLGKFVSRNVVNPGPGITVGVPIGFVPFVSWNTAIGNNGFLCAQPVSAEVRLNITCNPVGGGSTVNVPMITLPMPAPTSPGVQAPPASPVVIPSGLLAAGVQYRCTVVGTYRVTFGDGTTVIGSGDTEFCLVDPAPADPSQPRLYLSRIDVGNGAYTLQQRGDQTIDYYLIANNSLTDTVVFDMGSKTNQIARLPSTDTFTTTVHAISAPFDDTDHYPQAFSGELQSAGFIPLPDPLERGLEGIDAQDYLGPGQTKIVAITTRSYGMCADGSCSDAVFRVDGEWLGTGEPAIGCAGTTVVVDDGTRSVTPLCELTDTISVNDGLRAIYSPAILDGSLKTSTMFPGNILTTTVAFPNPTAPKKPKSGQIVINDLAGTQVVGSSFASSFGVEGYDAFQEDSIRLEHEPDTISYVALLYNSTDDAQPQHRMEVTITNFAGNQFSSIPFIRTATGTSDFKVVHDRTKATIKVTDGRRTITSGDFFEALDPSNLPNGIVVDFSTARAFQKNLTPTGGYPQVYPPAGTSNGTSFPGAVVLNGNAASSITSGSTFWSTVSGMDVNVVGSVPYGSLLTGTVITSSLPAVPAPPAVNVLRGFDSTSSQEVYYPIAVRQDVLTSTFQIPDVKVDSVAIKVDFSKPETTRDSLKVKFRFLVEDPSKSLAGQRFAVTIGGVTRTFTLDAKGKATDAATDTKFRLKVKGNSGQASLTIKKSELAGFLADEGIVDANISNGTRSLIELRFLFCGEQGQAFATIELKAKQGKNAKAKQAKD